MWQSPNQRARAVANARKRERDRLSHPFHIRRVAAELKIVSTDSSIPLPARVILNDFSPQGTGVFTLQSLVPGQEVILTLKDPKPIELKGRVVSCQEFDNRSHILSPNTFTHRLGIRFIFQSQEQEQAAAAYYNELMTDYLHGSKAA